MLAYGERIGTSDRGCNPLRKIHFLRMSGRTRLYFRRGPLRGRRSKVQQKLHIRKFCVQLLGVTSPGRTLIETKINWGRRGSPAVKIQCNLKKCGSDYIEFNREPHHRACLRGLESYSEFMLPYLPSHRGIGLPIALYVEHAIV